MQAALLGICFLISLNYYLLRTLKDAVFLTASDVGAEVIPFVKTWAVAPAILLLAGAFSVAIRYFSLRQIFLFSLWSFLLFFLCFSFIIYPSRGTFELNETAQGLESFLPIGWYGLAALVRHWALMLFYVVAECWGAIFYYVVFWGIINAISNYESAKESFPRLMLAGNLGAVFAGAIGYYLTFSDWLLSVQALTLAITGAGIGMAFLFSRLEIPASTASACAAAPTMREALPMLMKSKVLWWMVLLVMGYNAVINISEVMWKDQILSFYSDPSSYHLYMQYVTVAIGVVSTLTTLFLTSSMLNKRGWEVTAMLTPVVYLATVLLFVAALFWGSPAVAATLGSLHVLLGKSNKYTLFDTTKEMAYLQLPLDERLRGKALVDGVGSRFGKSISSFYLQGILLFFSSFAASLTSITFFLVVASVVIFYCIFRLSDGVEVLAAQECEC